ncbi:MAG TPA: trehalose-phosphatase [Burkholderiaceae bacterium]|nr:trehalose-phosphatase [Burkholderiaceae bacterium]
MKRVAVELDQVSGSRNPAVVPVDRPCVPPNLAIQPSRLAIFLDVDGTLAPLTERPDQTRIPRATRFLLLQLQSNGVALAALSGRPLSQVRRLLYPVEIPMGGSHGGQIRYTAGRALRTSPLLPSDLVTHLQAGVSNIPGVWLERKPGAVAVHWRQAPDARSEVNDLVRRLVQRAPGWHMMEGHCVHEIKAGGRHKGLALRRFMRQPEFAGRWPLAIGDDRTDEDAFAAACALGGSAIRVGRLADTMAPWQVPDVDELAVWLSRLLKRIEVKSVLKSKQVYR